MTDIITTIRLRLEQFAKDCGQQIPMPPLVADVIENRRRLLAKVHGLCEKNSAIHTGWAEVMGAVTDVDAMTRLSFCEELAEAWNVPLSFPTSFEYTFMTEPARLYAICVGMLPLVHKQKATPQLLRVAWDGVEAEMWDAEDVLMGIPGPLHPLPEEILTMTNGDEGFEYQGVDSWFV